MILYRKVCGGICLVFRPSGAVLRAFVPGTLAAAWGVCLELWARDLLGADLKHAFHHPYPYQIFTLVFGFLLVFRTNFAYHRYWNASTFVTQMHSKWGDAVLSLLSFDAMNADQDAARAAARREFRLRFVHLFSLLSAVALAQLRFDRNLANLDPDEHDADDDGAAAPDASPAGTPFWRRGSGGLVQVNEEVAERDRRRSARSSLGAAGDRRRVVGASSPSPEKRGRAEFDGVRAMHRRNPLLVIGGLCAGERRALGEAADPQFVVMQWVIDSVTTAEQSGFLQAAAPVVSRVYQELSDGQLGFSQAQNIAKTPFPFPYAQAVACLMVLFTFSAPVLMAAWLDGAPAVGSLTAICVWAYFALNEARARGSRACGPSRPL